MNQCGATQAGRSARIGRSPTRLKLSLQLKPKQKKTAFMVWGLSQQRKAIVDGLAESITELKEANVGMTEEQIMSILLTNQYLDTLNTFAS